MTYYNKNKIFVDFKVKLGNVLNHTLMAEKA
jgi:hypothetical protein